MTPVKSLQRYKCDYCKHRGIKRRMEWHEKVCYYNLNRECDTCAGTGQQWVDGDEDWEGYYIDCKPCVLAAAIREEKYDTKSSLKMLKK